MILAKGAAQVTAVAAHRKDRAAGVEPAQRLFFDGIQRHGRDPAVIIRNNRAADVRPRAAKPPAPLRDVAVAKAYIASRHTCNPPLFGKSRNQQTAGG